MERIICLAIGYALGLFQTAYIFGRAFKHIDIRAQGSGNSGTTNAFRVMGKKAGVIVFLGDFLKVVIAYFGAYLYFKSVTFGIYAAFGCILGHNFPFYMGFKGGKGIACSLGLMICINPLLALITYLIGLVVFKLKHYVSLSSLVMVAVYPILMLISRLYEPESIILMVLIAILAYYKHRENIKRLINGTENKFSVKKE